jgi:hydrogenase small subunit
MRWNNGVSYPIQSGHGCIGCSENHYWDNGPFYRHLALFPGFGIETTADTVGLALGAAIAVGITAHAISTNIRKRHADAADAKTNAQPAEFGKGEQ